MEPGVGGETRRGRSGQQAPASRQQAVTHPVRAGSGARGRRGLAAGSAGDPAGGRLPPGALAPPPGNTLPAAFAPRLRADAHCRLLGVVVFWFFLLLSEQVRGEEPLAGRGPEGSVLHPQAVFGELFQNFGQNGSRGWNEVYEEGVVIPPAEIAGSLSWRQGSLDPFLPPSFRR